VNLKKAVDAYLLGNILAEDLPAVAQQALEDGYDSPSLCELAGAELVDTYRLRDLFTRTLVELNLNDVSPADAGLAMARSIASDVVAGSITPYAGAKRIWSDIYTRFPHLARLRPFVGFASEFEDDEKHRVEYERLILDECKLILSEFDEGG